MSKGQGTVGPYTEQVARYIADASFEALPSEVVEQGKKVALDILGVLVADSRLKIGEIIIEFVRQLGGRPESSVIGADFKTSVVDAALCNGTLGHADELDDSHFASLTHPSCIIAPAALAVAERERSSGKDFITALVLGYDVQARIGVALDCRRLRDNNHHGSSICGNYGACSAASHLLGLDLMQTVYALGLTTSQASGILAWMTEDEHMAKSFQTGIASRNGVTAALLAKNGYTGPPSTLDDPKYNIFQAFSGGVEDFPPLVADLGSYFHIMGTGLKKYSAGRPIHAPLDGLLKIRREQKLTGNDIQEITVWLGKTPADIVDGRDTPSIGLQYIMAVAAYDGKVEMEQSHSEARTKDPVVLDLRQRVRLERDDELERIFPRTRAGIVEVVTKDGRRFKERVDYATGSPENPMTKADVEEKTRSLATPVIGREKTERLIEMCRKLDRVDDMREVANLLRV